jgi:2-oxo-4-hydroxy-4-carboxy-5-ureidoimidazoline decarboxylase
MNESERIAVLNAHPRIGADPASLSALSRLEQGGDADVTTLRELATMNDAYERRFGFRFVVFVAGRSKAEIVPLMRERLTRSREDELGTGIAEFLAIARDRLERAT